MRWVTRGNPTKPGRYAVTQGGSWFAANWTEDFGWFDGYRKVLHVKAWCEVPEPPGGWL